MKRDVSRARSKRMGAPSNPLTSIAARGDGDDANSVNAAAKEKPRGSTSDNWPTSPTAPAASPQGVVRGVTPQAGPPRGSSPTTTAARTRTPTEIRWSSRRNCGRPAVAKCRTPDKRRRPAGSPRPPTARSHRRSVTTETVPPPSENGRAPFRERV